MASNRIPKGIHNIEAEMSALGSMLYGERPLMAVQAVLRPEMFFLDAHRAIFGAVARLHAARKPVDLVTLKNELLRIGKLEEIGGEEYLVRIAEFVPGPSNAAYYAEIVRDQWQLRDMESRARKIIEAVHSDDAVEPAAIRAMFAEASSKSSPIGVCELWQVPVPEGAVLGLPTGFRSLDETIETEGYPAGQTTAIVAETNRGKTALMLSSISLIQQADRDTADAPHILFATFADLDAQQIKRRFIRNLCGWGKRPTKSLEEAARYDAAVATVSADPCFGGWDVSIYDAVGHDDGYDVESFCAWSQFQHAEKPFAAIFIDYAQEMTTRDPKADNTVAEQKVCASRVNRLARQLDVPVIVGSQTTRSEGKSRTMYSRAWEQKAGWILEIADDMDKITVRKNRFGLHGVEIPFRFIPERARFEEVGW